MRKLLLAILGLALCCIAWGPFGLQMIGGSTVPSSSALFYWDCEQNNSNSPVITPTVNSDAELSTTYKYAGSYSLKSPTGYDYYSFATTAPSNTTGSISLRVYGNFTDIGTASGLLSMYGDASNMISIYHYTGNKIKYSFTGDGSNYSFYSTDTLTSDAWNLVELTYDMSGGTTDYIGITINGGTTQEDSRAGIIWDTAVSVSSVIVGTFDGTGPSGVAVYIDEVTIE